MTAWRDWTSSPRALVSAALACALAATAATFADPPAGITSRRLPVVKEDALDREKSAMKLRYLRAGRAARRVHVRDSLRGVAPGVARGNTRAGLTLAVGPNAKSHGLEDWRASLQRAWDGFAIAEPKVPVVLAVLAADSLLTTSFAALPSHAGEACVVVSPTGGERPRSAEQQARTLRYPMLGCAFHARYGMPGKGVSAELRRIGWQPLPSRPRAADFLYFSAPPPIQSSILLANRWSANDRDLPSWRCAAGRLADCADHARTPVPRSGLWAPYMAASSARGPETAGQTLLPLLQLVLPATQFERLWKDDRPFDAALEEITGRGRGAWVYTAVLRGGTPVTGAFESTRPQWQRALLFLLIAALVGVALHHRRTVI